MKKRFSIHVGIGAPSLLTIFLVLSLISFSVLSYMTSRANFRFVENLEERTTAYYTASNQGEMRLAKIQSLLEEIPTWADNADYFQQANITLATNVPGAVMDAEHNVSFSIVINENQDLQISIQLLNPDEAGNVSFIVTRWQVIQTGEWEPDNKLNLLEGA
ncbi:MAG: hypothetical protein FWE25_09170 [Lachnospiraceae bacterium]|nr:hypothetical protein [Lachnospiraceae bacterium]